MVRTLVAKKLGEILIIKIDECFPFLKKKSKNRKITFCMEGKHYENKILKSEKLN